MRATITWALAKLGGLVVAFLVGGLSTGKGGQETANFPVSSLAYRVKIDPAGIDPFASDTVVLGAGERRELPIVAVRVPMKITAVDVTATVNEVGAGEGGGETTHTGLFAKLLHQLHLECSADDAKAKVQAGASNGCGSSYIFGGRRGDGS
jgi:hypothetical protein